MEEALDLGLVVPKIPGVTMPSVPYEVSPPPLSKDRPGSKKVRSDQGVVFGQAGLSHTKTKLWFKKVRSDQGVVFGQAGL